MKGFFFFFVRNSKLGIAQTVCLSNTFKSYQAEAAQGDTAEKGNRAAKQPQSLSEGLACPDANQKHEPFTSNQLTE